MNKLKVFANGFMFRLIAILCIFGLSFLHSILVYMAVLFIFCMETYYIGKGRNNV